MKRQSVSVVAFVFFTALALNVGQAWATNGMNVIGFGARQSGMGGVSMGLGNDVNLMNTNPAGIAFMTGQHIGLNAGLLMPAVHFQNSMNDLDANSAIFPLPTAGYVNGLGESRFAVGFGLCAQGGMGATYDEVKHTIFRSYDMNPATQGAEVPQKYHSKIAYMKAVPTIAYKITPEFSVGAGLQVGYALLQMQMPYSLLPGELKGEIPGMGGMTYGDMFGSPQSQGGLGYDEITAYADMGDGVTAMGFGGQLGFQYKPTKQLTFGAAYTSSSTLDMSGDASMDMTSQFGDAFERMVAGALMQMGADPMNPTDTELQTAQGGVGTQLSNMGIDMSLGMQDDYDAEISFSWPQQFAVGAAFAASDKLMLATDVRWINWKDSMEKFKMKFTGGTNANINAMMGAPDGTLNLEMPMNWDDQIVIAFGAEYKAGEKWTLRGGFNYASNPVPEETVIPIFPAVVESHVTLGVGYAFSEVVRVDVAYEFVPAKELKPVDSIIANEYDNSASKLGENLIHGGIAISL